VGYRLQQDTLFSIVADINLLVQRLATYKDLLFSPIKNSSKQERIGLQ